MSKSKAWLHEHFTDQYVKRAQAAGYPSRAAYKLLEIQQKDRIFKPGMRVVDLGAAPGGWSMVASELVGDKGQVFALDRLPMDPLPGIRFIEGDFTDDAIAEALLAELNGARIDVVMSDMAPNMSGQASIDQPRSMVLVELAWHFAQQVLAPEGVFLAKVFQGAGVDEWLRELRQAFRSVKIRKPDASRARSREVYVLGVGFLGYTE